MILNNAPANEAVMSNVGEIGEFRIRNSAKAFNILSSGLYANKIKAIVRELSCNAVDSHTAAGKADVPFEVHLPNALEPHFSIRDFGTGLTHDQVTSIYTTYFESTKTDSNAFIGALGLGSKSPFSYTDNFTVTAIKDGHKGIYSAFINGEGVPSIALMMQEETDEPAGVEIKFSVNDRYDYTKFREEAVSVYRYFKLKPNISGALVTIEPITYETENLIPGVHVRHDSGHTRRSVAVMGNIAYPIEVPNATQFGDLRFMLDCGLEIHFGIGEVDFQASREGLSYIPQTIDAIKRKLEAINSELAQRIKTDAEVIPNLWDRAIFLQKKYEHPLWVAAVNKYVVDSKLPTACATGSRYKFLKDFKIKVEDLASLYNISIRGFVRSRGASACSTLKVGSDHARSAQGQYMVEHSWTFTVSNSTDFVINDTKVGIGERAKYHYRDSAFDSHSRAVYILDKADPNKDMNTDEFFKAIANPPETRIMAASLLKQKPRLDSSVGRNVSILGLKSRTTGYHRNEELVWVDAGKLSDFVSTTTYYYVPLSGYTVVGRGTYADAKVLHQHLSVCGIKSLRNIAIYGVRKADMESIKKQSNWVNVEDFIESSLTVPDNNVILNMAENDVQMFSFMGNRYGDSYKFDSSLLKDGSPFKEFCKKYDGFTRVKFSESALRQLYIAYGKKLNFDLASSVKEVHTEFLSVKKRYPLLDSIDSGASADAVAEYVNLIDSLKGI